MKKICFLLLFLYLTVAAFGQTTKSGITQSKQLSSRAWYVLRQSNAGPLLLALSQRLGKVIESSQRNDFMWVGTEQGGSIKFNIAVDGDVTGEIFIGFFKDPDWSSEPVQVRSFSGPGEYLIENLPPGKFQIGAMIGSLPVATALGVHQMWPDPIEIERSKTSSVKVLVSRYFQLYASGRYNNTISRDFIGDWKDIDPDNFLQGRVTGPEGQSVAFATVQIREHNPGARSIRAPNRGTNEQGYYKCDDINWPYRVGVIRYKLMPYVLGYCHQYLLYNRTFQECEKVDFQFDNYPVGNATVEGQVLDQKGDPLKEFFIDVRTKMDFNVTKNPDGKFYSITGYHVPFVSEDGSFKLSDLPQGDFTASVIPFDIKAYELHRGEDVILEAGKATTINLKVISKKVLYGRVLFRDGSPAVIKPAPWVGAKTSIIMPMGSRARGIAEVDDEGYFTVNLFERELKLLESGASRLIVNVPTSEERRRKSMGDFPFEKLAADKDKAGVLRIERPDRKPLLLIGKSLPGFDGIMIELNIEKAEKKNILICFFDMNQRPSRRCISQLNEQIKQLADKGVTVIAIQASEVDENSLNEWVKSSGVSFPVGMIETNIDEVKLKWGVKGLPWLILTDKNHTVIAEGFGIDELEDKI